MYLLLCLLGVKMNVSHAYEARFWYLLGVFRNLSRSTLFRTAPPSRFVRCQKCHDRRFIYLGRFYPDERYCRSLSPGALCIRTLYCLRVKYIIVSVKGHPKQKNEESLARIAYEVASAAGARGS